MSKAIKAPKDHWSHHWTTDQAAECLPYKPVSSEEGVELYKLLWNEIGPDLPLHEHWGKLTEAQQDMLDKAYVEEYGF